MKTLKEIMEQARAALPAPEDYPKDEVKVISSVFEHDMTDGKAGTITFTLLFQKVLEDGVPAWELKDVISKSSSANDALLKNP